MKNLKYLKSFGEHLRQLRELSGLTQKEVAIKLSIDNSLLAKIERNERPPTKQFITNVAIFFNVDEKELQNEYLSDQIAYRIIGENADLDILRVAEKKVSYLKNGVKC
jgi:transcriptional regulator with XRE-family HTH domain